MPESRERIRQRVAALAAGQPVGLIAHRLLKLDGSGPVDVESVSIPIEFDGSRAALTVARDITVSKRLAEELRHAQRLESVGQLAGGVAHDFNNLLSVILSYGELLVEKLPEESPLVEFARETVSAAERAAALTRQLLTFSRKQAVEARQVRLDEIARGTEKLLRRLIGPPVQLRFSCRDAGVVLADPGQLEQVIVNLAVNARDAMPDGGELSVATGTARVEAADPRWPGLLPGAYATLFVRDSGQGMMGGHRLSRALRDRGSSLLMLLTSGFAGPEVFPDGRRVLQKPLQTATLAAALAEALGVRGALGG